jgi:hypothetical protein
VAACEQLAQQHAQRPHVGGGGHGLAPHLLGRGPGGGKGTLAGARDRRGGRRRAVFAFVEQPRDAEVQQLDLALAVDHHVARLQVAMHHQLRVGGGDGLHHVDEQPQAGFHVQLALIAPAIDGLAAHQLQHQVGLATFTVAGHPGVEQARDVWVFQPRQDAALALEALARLGAVQAPVHQLDGGLAVVAAVAAARQPHAGHAAFPQRRFDGPRPQVMACAGQGRCGLRRAAEEVLAAGGFLPCQQTLQDSGVLREACPQLGQPGRALGFRKVQRFIEQRADALPGVGVGNVGVSFHRGGGACRVRGGLCTGDRNRQVEAATTV